VLLLFRLWVFIVLPLEAASPLRWLMRTAADTVTQQLIPQ